MHNIKRWDLFQGLSVREQPDPYPEQRVKLGVPPIQPRLLPAPRDLNPAHVRPRQPQVSGGQEQLLILIR